MLVMSNADTAPAPPQHSGAGVCPVSSTLPAPPPPDFRRDCSCCSAVIVAADWLEMPYVGAQDDGDGGWLELRNHGCGSTIAREL